MTALPAPVVRVAATAFHHGDVVAGTRLVPEETAVALSYDRVGYAVMMATPRDLEDFAIGFSLSEGIVDRAEDVRECRIVAVEDGVECRMRVGAEIGERLARRRRHLAGALGCGLCGLESLAEANRRLPMVGSALTVSAEAVMQGMRAMAAQQALNRETRAVHAAGFLDPADGAVLVREDVGRHNALDKVFGALARAGRAAAGGVVLMTSRVSIELIQKCAVAGAPVIVAVSVPSAHAIRAAESAGLTLAAVARDDGFEVFTHETRIRFGAASHVA